MRQGARALIDAKKFPEDRQGSAYLMPQVLVDATHRMRVMTEESFGPVVGNATLSGSGDLTEAAANLFEKLHEAEASTAQTIAVVPIPETGLGAAINDRLRRAAAPR